MSQVIKTFHKLEELIITTQLKPGYTYSEKELLNIVGLGRTPLREALQRLEVIGLVKIKHRKGIQITEVDADVQLRLLKVRRPLQNFVAKHVAQHACDSDRENMLDFAQTIQQESIEIPKSKIESLIVARKTHDLLLSSCDNEFAVKTLQIVQGLSRRFWVYYVRPEESFTAIKLQGKLLKEVAEGNVEKSILASNKIIDYLESFAQDIKTWQP